MSHNERLAVGVLVLWIGVLVLDRLSPITRPIDTTRADFIMPGVP